MRGRDIEEISDLMKSNGEFASSRSPELVSSPLETAHQSAATPLVTMEEEVEEERSRKKRRLFRPEVESCSDPSLYSTGT